MMRVSGLIVLRGCLFIGVAAMGGVVVCPVFGGAAEVDSQGAWQGDPELLKSVIVARRNSIEKIVTWKGEASITVTRLTEDGRQKDQSVSRASFAMDLSADAVRWRWIGTEEGSEVIRAGMQLGGRWYKFDPGFIDLAGKKHNTLVIWPKENSNRMSGATSYFHPMKYIEIDGIGGVEKSMMLSYDSWGQGPSGGNEHGVIREDNSIRVFVKNRERGLAAEWVFDTSMGGHLTKWSSEGPVQTLENSNKFEWVYVQVNGVWVPSTYSDTYRQRNPDGTSTWDVRRVVFERQAVNVPIDPNEFSLAALGVTRGTRVADRVVGIAYEYGKTPGDPAAEDLALEALAQTNSSPKEVNAPAGPNTIGGRVLGAGQPGTAPPDEFSGPGRAPRPGRRSGWLAVGLGLAVLVVVLAVIVVSRRGLRKP